MWYFLEHFEIPHLQTILKCEVKIPQQKRPWKDQTNHTHKYMESFTETSPIAHFW